jgi:hypothetical protein
LGGAFHGLLHEIGVFNIKFCFKTPLKVELKQAPGSLKLQEEKKPHQKEEPMPSLQRGLPSFFHFPYPLFSLQMWHCQCQTIATLMATIASTHDHHYHNQELELLTNPSSTTTPRGAAKPPTSLYLLR